MNRRRRTRPLARKLHLAVSAALGAVLLGALGPASAGAAAAPARPAASPARPAPAPASQNETWLGRIQRDGRGYAYVGRACPEQAEICYDIVAKYRIVALNPTAARAVRRLSGGQAPLQGHLGPGQDGGQNGTLFVTKAERPRGGDAKTVQADDASNGQTVTLKPGDHLQVVLHSTYWTFDDPSDPAVISSDGDPVVAGGGPKCGGPPGSGCGTVTARFTAQHAGKAMVSAHRTSCGEALRCSPEQSRWGLSAKVSG